MESRTSSSQNRYRQFSQRTLNETHMVDIMGVEPKANRRSFSSASFFLTVRRLRHLLYAHGGIEGNRTLVS